MSAKSYREFQTDIEEKLQTKKDDESSTINRVVDFNISFIMQYSFECYHYSIKLFFANCKQTICLLCFLCVESDFVVPLLGLFVYKQDRSSEIDGFPQVMSTMSTMEYHIISTQD